MLHELPWLPQPTQNEREAWKQFGDLEGLADIGRLAALSGRRWNDAELAAIGRKLRKMIRGAANGWQAEARALGFSPVSLLMLYSSTASHMIEALMATALRYGIILDCRVVEYQEPEVWITQNADQLRQTPTDAIVLSLDRHALRLHAQLNDADDATRAVDAAVSRIARICEQVSSIAHSPIILESLPRSATDPQGGIDAWLPGSPRTLIADFNRRISTLRSTHSCTILDVAGMADLVGLDVWDAGRFRHTAKMAFSPACVPLYATRLASLLASQYGRSRRVLVLDLDNTLWGGIVGDDGVEGLLLGGNSAVGKAHVEIQQMARGYRERGILLCVASKNTREIALDAFRRHPEMILKESDISLFEINWESKVAGITAMAKTLNLGLDAFVFVDDNPIERKQVRDALPMVAVPELPQDPSTWLPVIQGAAYFDQQSLSTEDLARAEYYKTNTQRAELQNSAKDEVTFLESLQMVMNITAFDPAGRKRIAQLVAKSNQFNLTTRRYSESQIADFESDESVETFQIRLSDIFGDNGMIAVVICRKGGAIWEIDTWLMSCRVLGRGVERATLNVLASHARAAGAAELRGLYIPTPKNGIVADHYEKLGFRKTPVDAAGQTMWTLALESFTPSPSPIEILEG